MEKNIAEINALADYLERLPTEAPSVGFNMDIYIGGLSDVEDKDHTGHDCETVACIAGHLWLLHLDEHLELYPICSTDYTKFGMEKLGLDPEEARELFLCTGPPDLHMGDITISEAVYTLRQLVLTGVVDWSHVAGA